MNREHVYVIATEDWTAGYFVVYMSDGWHVVQWSCSTAEVQPKYYDSCAVSEMWAAKAIEPNPHYPVYMEYEYVGK